MTLTADTSALLDGIRDHLAGFVPHTVTVDDAALTTRQVVVETAGTPRREALTLGADVFGHLTIQIRCIDTTRNAARKTGDVIREALTGQDEHGAWAHPIAIAGYHLDRPIGAGDGFLMEGSPAQHVERFTLRWQ